MRQAVFLDRDGVLNEPVVRDGKPYPPQRVEELIVSSGAREALDRLRAAEFLLICVTNQPDVARGTTPRSIVDAIHERLQRELMLDDILVCPHDDADECLCRKPRAGLVIEGARRHGVDTHRSYLVGDRWRDIEAGAAANCRTVFVDRAYDDERSRRIVPDATVRSITDAATWILAHHQEQHAVN